MNENEKLTEGQKERKPTTASEFRERFVKGKLVTSPSESTYRIRPIAPHFFLNHYSQRLISFLPAELKGKEVSAEQVAAAIPESEQVNAIQAIRPVLCAGVIEPKIVDTTIEKRPLRETELAVDDLLAMEDDAFWLYSQIHLLSRGNAQLGDSFRTGSGSGA